MQGMEKEVFPGRNRLFVAHDGRRRNLGDDIGRADHHQHGHEQRACIEQHEIEPAERNGHVADVIGRRIEREQVEEVLQGAHRQADDIAPEHAFGNQEKRLPQENLAYRPVGAAQGFERADKLHAVQNQDEQAGNHVEARHGQHQHDNDPDIHIQQLEPRKELRVQVLHGLGVVGVAILIETVRRGEIDLVGHGVEVREIVNLYFQAAVLRVFPSVEALHLAHVANQEELVVVGKAGVIYAADAEFARTDIVLDKIGEKCITHLQTHEAGQPPRHQHTVGHNAVGQHRHFALDQTVTEKLPIEIHIHPFQDNALKVGFAFEYAGLGAETVHAAHALQGLQAVHQRGIDADGLHLETVVVLEVRYLYVRPEADDLVAYFLLEADHDGNGDEHDRQPDPDAERGHPHRRTGHAAFRHLRKMDAPCYEILERQTTVFLFRPPRQPVVLLLLHDFLVGIQRLAEHNERVLQVFLAQHVGNTHLVTSQLALGVETARGRQHDSLALVLEIGQQPRAELVGIVNGQTRHGVERTHWYGRINARDTVQAVNQELAPLHVLVVHFEHVLLRRVHAGFRHNLPEQRRAQARLAELHDALAHFLVLGHQRADTDAALAVTFRHGIDQNDILLNAVQVEGRNIGRARVAELAVNLVGEQVEVVLLDQVAYLVHFLAGVQVTGRVVRVANQYALGARRNQGLETLHGRQGETVLNARHDRFDNRAGGYGKGRVVGICRLRHNDFIARVKAGHERELHRFGTARRNDDFLGAHFYIETLVVKRHFLAQGLEAVARAVFQHLAVDVAHRLQTDFRRLQIGLPDVQMVHFHAARLGLVGQRDQLADRRFGHLLPAHGNLWHSFISNQQLNVR